MAEAKLVRFVVEPAGRHYTLRVDSDRGESFAVVASREQIEIMLDTLDDILLTDEADDAGPEPSNA